MRTPVSDPRDRTPSDPNAPSDPGAPLDPAEGRPDMDLPGADRPDPVDDPDDELPQRLGERDDKAGGIASGEPDLLPDVKVPQSSM